MAVFIAGGHASSAWWEGLWAKMPMELLISSGLRAHDCADMDNCIGVLGGVGERVCACYSK
jgi:hypothetical protein